MDCTALTPLAEYGPVGICFLLIFLLAFFIKIVFKLIGNHMEHTTEAINKNTEVLSKTEEMLDQGLSATKENIQVTRDLKEFLILSNGKYKRKDVK